MLSYSVASLAVSLSLGLLSSVLATTINPANGPHAYARRSLMTTEPDVAPYQPLPDRDMGIMSVRRGVGRHLRPDPRAGIRKKTKSGDFSGVTLPPLSPTSWTYAKSNVNFDGASSGGPSSPHTPSASPDRPFLGDYWLAPSSPNDYERSRGHLGFVSPGLVSASAGTQITVVDTSAGIASPPRPARARRPRVSPHRQRVQVTRLDPAAAAASTATEDACPQPGQGCDMTSPLLSKPSPNDK